MCHLAGLFARIACLVVVVVADGVDEAGGGIVVAGRRLARVDVIWRVAAGALEGPHAVSVSVSVVWRRRRRRRHE